MLQYLVTSKARRRLLALLWGEGARGSVAELAERADVTFSNAHGELKSMEHLQLVMVAKEGRRDVFAANATHPAADMLRALVASDRATAVAANASDEALKRQLVALGAPLRGVPPLAVADARRLEILAEGVSLARRDPTVARCFPICVWKQRDHLDVRKLLSLLARAEEKHAFGFFLELAGELGGDRKLVGLAELMRDRRMTSVREFFQGTNVRRKATRELPLAERWGFRLNLDHDSFATLFNKFVKQ